MCMSKQHKAQQKGQKCIEGIASHLALLRGGHHLREHAWVARDVAEERDQLAQPPLRVLEPLLHAARALVALLHRDNNMQERIATSNRTSASVVALCIPSVVSDC
jgi:hypothetical protein